MQLRVLNPVRAAHALLRARALAFDPSQARDEHGRWTDTGASSLVPSGIVDAIQQADGGFTYSPLTGESPTSGYALSLHPEREYVIDARQADVVELATYAAQNWDLLKERGNYFGAWHNPQDDKVYLDISTVVENAEDAERLGRDANQLAYFDLKHGKSIEIVGGRRHGIKAATQFDWSRDRAAFTRRHHRVVAPVDRARTHRNRDQQSQAYPRFAGGPGSGNFGHAGRPGEVGGSSVIGGSTTFFHGTAERNLHTILQNGLLQRWSGRVWDGSKPGHVYVTTSLKDAQYFAQTAANRISGGGVVASPAVLQIDVPADKVDQFLIDTVDKGNAREFAGDIPADWITHAWTREGPFMWDDPKPWVKVLATRTRFYVAIALIEQLKTAGGKGSGNFGQAGRPGQVGGSAVENELEQGAYKHTLSVAFREQPLPSGLTEAEDRIRHEQNEHAYVIRDGKAIQYLGQDHPSSVVLDDISPSDTGTVRDPYRDVTFTHNHPDGTGLSPADIYVAASHNMREIRAVGSNGVTFSAKRIDDTWPDADALMMLQEAENTTVHAQFLERIQNGTMTIQQAERTHWPEVWRRVARTVNMAAERIRFSTHES